MGRLKRFVAVCLVFLTGLVIASEIWPERAAKVLLAGLHASAGLEKSAVDTSFGTVQFLEGGEGETVVFLHGIFALKEHWIDMSRQVSGDYHVILLDLPGFGENPRLEAEQYDFARQTENVLEALDAMGIEQFHIAANSMGAQIAGQIAVSFPDRVRSVAFIGSPVGVTSPVKSDMERAIESGEAPLVVTTLEEFEARMDWLFPERPFLPRPIARYWAADEVAHAQKNQQIWDAVGASGGPRLEDLAPRIYQPSLIIWCEEDRIFHISGADVLAEALPDVVLEQPTGCGHLPMLDRPAETGRLFNAFLSDLG